MAIAFKHLAKRPDGRTHIVGRRLTPYDVMCQHELGRTPEDIAEGYELNPAAVFEALAYAFENRDEMARMREANNAASRRILLKIPEHLRRGIPIP